jgi:glycyl-tRNA synthetase (class II)
MDCKSCKSRLRADKIIDAYLKESGDQEPENYA